MTRVRYDPSFFEDERWEHLGAEAMVLHISGLSYVVRTLSDGLMTAKRVLTLAPMLEDVPRARDALLADGIWSEAGADTIRICDVRDDLRHADGRGDEQPSRQYVESERQRARKAKETWRAKRNAERNGVPNAAHASAVQARPVQDPSGPGPACPHQKDRSSCAACRAPRCEHDRLIGADGSGCVVCAEAASVAPRRAMAS